MDYNSQLECLSPYKYKNTKKINKGICEIKKNIFGTIVIEYKKFYSYEPFEWLEWLEDTISYWANKNLSLMDKITPNYKNLYFRIYNNIPKKEDEYFTLIDFDDDSLYDNEYCKCNSFNCDCIPEALERIIDIMTIQEVKDLYDYNDGQLKQYFSKS